MGIRVITSRVKFPACIQPFEKVKGIVIGGCIREVFGDQYPISSYPGTSEYDLARSFGDLGHAHPHHYYYGSKKNDEYGFICSRFEGFFRDRQSLLHEVAHLLAKPEPSLKDAHDRRWAKTLLKIGGTLKPCPIDYWSELGELGECETLDYSHLLYPDDKGFTWQLKRLIGTLYNRNESALGSTKKE